MRLFGLPAILTAMVALVAFVVPPASAPRSLAQGATPVASPVAGAVPCTALFGIAAGNACLIFLQGSPDAGPIDMYIDGALAVQGASFGGLGEFIPVAAGERQFQLAPSGAGFEGAVLDARFRLDEGIAYEIAALGPVAQLTAKVLPVDTSPLPVNTARLRVAHGAVNVEGIDLAITGGVPLVLELEPGDVSVPVQIPAGTYELEVREAGSTDVVLPLPGTVLAPTTTYTVHVIGSAADGTLGAVLIPVFVTPEIAAAATPVA